MFICQVRLQPRAQIVSDDSRVSILLFANQAIASNLRGLLSRALEPAWPPQDAGEPTLFGLHLRPSVGLPPPIDGSAAHVPLRRRRFAFQRRHLREYQSRS